MAEKPASRTAEERAAEQKAKALDSALGQIDRQYGKGAVMRLGDDQRPPIEAIPTEIGRAHV